MNHITPDLIRQAAHSDVYEDIKQTLLIIAEAMAEDRREIDRLNQEVLRLKGLTREDA